MSLWLLSLWLPVPWQFSLWALGLATTGVRVEHVVNSPVTAALPGADRWLICGAISILWHH